MRDGHSAIGFGTDYYVYASSGSGKRYAIGIGIISSESNSYGEFPVIDGALLEIDDSYPRFTPLYLQYSQSGNINTPGGAIIL